MGPAKRRPTAQPTGEPSSKSSRHGARSSVTPLSRSSSQTLGPSSSQSSYTSRSTPASSFSLAVQHPPRSSWVEEDYDVPEPSQNDDDPVSSYELYGTLDTKIVGVRYYNGVVNPGEKVLCRREPSNPFDRNAVRVDNVMRTQIGHLPAVLVKKLAPYLDRNDIILDGVLTGPKDVYDCPVRLVFYGTSDPQRRLELEAALKADKLLKATQLKATRNEAEAQRNAAARLRCNATTVGLGTAEEVDPEETLEQLLQESESTRLRGDLNSMDVFAMDEESLSRLPKAAQPPSIQSMLLPHQLQVSIFGSIYNLEIIDRYNRDWPG